MALDQKHNETRHWPTTFRGDLVICAAKRKMTADETFILDHFVKLPPGYVIPYGHAVCVVEMFDCVPTRSIIGRIDAGEHNLGNYSDGRFAWLTRNLRRLHSPVPVRGAQGFFRLSPEVEAAVREQLGGSVPPEPVPKPHGQQQLLSLDGGPSSHP